MKSQELYSALRADEGHRKAEGPRSLQPRAAMSNQLYRTRAKFPASVHSSPRTRIR